MESFGPALPSAVPRNVARARHSYAPRLTHAVPPADSHDPLHHSVSINGGMLRADAHAWSALVATFVRCRADAVCMHIFRVVIACDGSGAIAQAPHRR